MTPFSNSMEPDNEPSDGSPNAGANDNRPGNGPTASTGAGADTPATSPGYPLPPDPHAPHGADGDNDQEGIQEYGVEESRDVGHTSSVHQYGLK